jgi:hypothetical protein
MDGKREMTKKQDPANKKVSFGRKLLSLESTCKMHPHILGMEVLNLTSAGKREVMQTSTNKKAA